jgi:hypothetical protein
VRCSRRIAALESLSYSPAIDSGYDRGLAAVTESELRRIYPAEDDPAALRVELSPAGISTPPDVSIIAIDAGTHGGSEAPVKIIMSAAQAADLARRLQALLDEMHA